MRLLGWLACHLFNDHHWTSRAQQGLRPEVTDLPQTGDTAAVTRIKFSRYATMYCSRCRKVYVPQ